MINTILWIVWAVTFGAGWICLDMFKKQKGKSFHKIALVMFGIATIVSVYKCLSLWIQ